MASVGKPVTGLMSQGLESSSCFTVRTCRLLGSVSGQRDPEEPSLHFLGFGSLAHVNEVGVKLSLYLALPSR